MYILSFKKTQKTGRKIAEQLGALLNTHIACSRNPVPSDSPFIRWGATQDEHLDSTSLFLNSAASIRLAGDKLRTFQALEGAGIPIPEYLTIPPPEGECWFGRKRRGFGAMDIKIQTESGDRPSGFYESEFFTKYIKNKREYRIHIVRDNVIRTQRKYLEDPSKTTEELIANHKNGYVFKSPRKKLREQRYDIARETVRTLGLDFGAVDMIIDEDGHEFVLEVNTAPGCSPITIDAYVQAFAKEWNGFTRAA